MTVIVNRKAQTVGRKHALIVGAMAALPLAFAASPASADESVDVMLNELNGSGATGMATLTAMDSGDLRVHIMTENMTPGMPHAQHIHGAPTGHNFFCPTQAQDANGDGQVSTEEGLAQYGDILISLTTSGDTTKASGLAVDRMPVADEDGMVMYDRVIPASALPAGTTEHLESLHIVQHGLDVNGNGKYDLKALGESVFANSLGVMGVPEEATNPATCGMVEPAGGVETGSASTAGTESLPLMTLGGLSLLGAGGVLAARRRFARAS